MARKCDHITVTLPVDVQYISVARLIAAGVAARAHLTVDEIEDLKVAVSEACTNVTEHAFSDDDENTAHSFRLRYSVSDGELTLEVEDEGRGFDPKHLPDAKRKEYVEASGLGLYLIAELMDEVDIQSAPGSGTKITMTKRSAR